VRLAYESLLTRLQLFERNANADLAALLHIELRGAIEEYEERKRRLGALDFVDLLIRVRDLLRANATVRAYFQKSISHLFVDEFQDTDPIQVEILMLLASDDPSVSDWRAVRPKAGKLFLVGDPKQSIYRFRRADLGMYAGVKKRLEKSGALMIDLSTSFRSLPHIQNFANLAFEPLMDSDPDAQQAAYVPLKNHRAALPDQPAVVALPVPKPYGGYRGISDEAIGDSLPDAVAAYVEWLLTKSNWKVTTREDPAPRDIEPRDICILFRRFETYAFDGKRSDVTRKYVHCLEARGIAQLLVGGKSFHGREEIETMRTALAAVEWPEDELSIYATLHGGLFGITDEELFEYRNRYKRLKPFAIPGDLPAHLAPIGDALHFIAALHGARNYRPVAETLRRLLTETRCHAGFVMRPSGKQVLANVMQLMEQARVYDEAGALSFRGFVEQLMDEAEHGRASEAPVLEEGSEGVRLMTVHKAKGLEFPIVILADITCNQIRESASRTIDGERNLAAMQICGFTPFDVLDQHMFEQARDRAEAVRLAYVAATRARDLLVVPAIADERLGGKWLSILDDALYPKSSQQPQVRGAYAQFGKDATNRPYDFRDRADATVKPGTYAFDGYEVTWWNTLALNLDVPIALGIPQQELLGKEAPEGLIEADTRTYEKWRDELATVVGKASAPSVVAQTAIERSHRESAAVPEVDVITIGGAHAGGARYGTLMHAVLASIDLDASRDDVRRVAELQSRILGATQTEVDDVTDAVVNVIAHPMMRRAQKARALRRETPVTLLDDGEVIEGNVDLAFEEESQWIVVDFKTDAEIGARLGMYKLQVGIYADAIAKATGKRAVPVLIKV
jgi:ATP-dependent exoDNAse (exonuclease V) beta subunit